VDEKWMNREAIKHTKKRVCGLILNDDNLPKKRWDEKWMDGEREEGGGGRRL